MRSIGLAIVLIRSFRLVQISVTLNDLERRNGPYFALYRRIRVRYDMIRYDTVDLRALKS